MVNKQKYKQVAQIKQIIVSWTKRSHFLQGWGVGGQALWAIHTNFNN